MRRSKRDVINRPAVHASLHQTVDSRRQRFSFEREREREREGDNVISGKLNGPHDCHYRRKESCDA